MLIKSQLEVHLHTGHSVHFHPSQFTRPSFSIFWGSGSETIHTHTHTTCLQIAMRQSAAVLRHILLYEGQGEEMAPNNSGRSSNLNRSWTADECLIRRFSSERISFSREDLCFISLFPSPSVPSPGTAWVAVRDDCCTDKCDLFPLRGLSWWKAGGGRSRKRWTQRTRTADKFDVIIADTRESGPFARIWITFKIINPVSPPTSVSSPALKYFRRAAPLLALPVCASCVTWRTNSKATFSANSKASGNFVTNSCPVYFSQFLQNSGRSLYSSFSFSNGFWMRIYWLYTCLRVLTPRSSTTGACSCLSRVDLVLVRVLISLWNMLPSRDPALLGGDVIAATWWAILTYVVLQFSTIAPSEQKFITCHVYALQHHMEGVWLSRELQY